MLKFILIALILSSCQEFEDNETGAFSVIENIDAELVDFNFLKQNILEKKGCITCHGWAKNQEAIDEYIVPGDFENSVLYQLVEDGDMPVGRSPLTKN